MHFFYNFWVNLMQDRPDAGKVVCKTALLYIYRDFFFLKATTSSLMQFNLWPIILSSYFNDSTYKIIL